MSEETKIRSSSSAHWYTRDGEAMHTYINTKGGESKTTLREARKFDLLPSVTSVLYVLAKPQIADWKATHYMNAAIEVAWDFLKENALNLNWRVWTKSRFKVYQSKVAVKAKELAEERMGVPAKLGTTIHNDIEAWLMGMPTTYLKEEALERLNRILIEILGPDWRDLDTKPELIVVGEDYAGCIDLLVIEERPDQTLHATVIDWKSQDTKKWGCSFWDDYIMQGSAYLEAARSQFGCITGDFYTVVISRDEPGVADWKKWTQDELWTGWQKFTHAKALWQLEKKFNPAK